MREYPRRGTLRTREQEEDYRASLDHPGVRGAGPRRNEDTFSRLLAVQRLSRKTPVRRPGHLYCR